MPEKQALYLANELLEDLSIEDSGGPVLVTSSVLSPVWKSACFVAQMNRVCRRGVSSIFTLPRNLIMLIACCSGYSFNHTNTRIGDHNIIQKGWSRLQTIVTKLESVDPQSYVELKRILGSSFALGYSMKMGVSPIAEAVDIVDRESADLVRQGDLIAESMTVDEGFPRVFFSVFHLILLAKAAASVSKM